MFSSVVKSFQSNINSNYILSPHPISQAGPWKIFDGKKKSTQQAVSVFVFDKRILDNSGGNSLSFKSNSNAGLKQAQDEVVERLKKEASMLAKLRHPSILELVEPVEETRNGLQFVTEQVTGSLGGLLKEKDDAERRGGGRGHVIEDDQGRRRRDVDLDELEIQKGLVQVGKALEFLHESAGLIHGNLTPDAVFVNAKSDWKLAGFSFTTPHNTTQPGASSVKPLSVQDMTHYDPRLPAIVQLNFDYSSPDLIMDSDLNPSMDMFSLGLLIVALYNFPHTSPIQSHNSTSSFKRALSSPTTTPNRNNNFLLSGSRQLPRNLGDAILAQLITRRPANRLTARAFQESPYFDNILVSTIRFLDGFAGKTPVEKASFLRGLPKVLGQFPKSVMEKKMLPQLVEELKDREALALVLPNIFGIVEKTSGRMLSEKVLPKLKTIFFPHGHPKDDPKNKHPPTSAEKDSGLQSGLSVIIDYMKMIVDNISAREFKEEMLPLIHLAMESSNHSLQDKALRSLSTFLSALDFPTLKNELFPVIVSVFTKTSSLKIKIRGLEAFKILLAGDQSMDDLNGSTKKPKTVTLDKYSVQEKLVPLLKAIKTKEPAVMMAALDVFKDIGSICDREIVATEVLPILWSMSLGPLLVLSQFQQFMAVIKTLSTKIEQEQTRKLSELATPNPAVGNDFMAFSNNSGFDVSSSHGGGSETDFEALVTGRGTATPASFDSGWGTSTPSPAPSRSTPQPPRITPTPEVPTFSWSSQTTTTAPPPRTTPKPSGTPMKTALQPSKPINPFAAAPAPSLTSFAPLRPSTTNSTPLRTTHHTPTPAASSTIDWTPATKPPTLSSMPILQPQPSSSSSSGWGGTSTTQNTSNQHPTILNGKMVYQKEPPKQQSWGAFSIPPPPKAPSVANMGSIGGGGYGSTGGLRTGPTQQGQGEGKTMDQWQSLL